MSYQVPQHIDPNKVFLVNLSQLEGRLDPSIYKPHFSFVSKKYKNAKLSEIAWIDPLCNFGESNEVSFIPMDAIDSTNGTVAYQGTKKVEDSKGFTRFREGDILWAKITPCMQNAKSAIAKNLLNGFGCGSTEFYVIRTKDENIVRQEYLLFLLRDERILSTAMNFFGGSAGQQRVSSIFLKTFNVPIPSIQEQKNICDILAKYSSLKQRKEQQAKDLLQSIDDYLLGELGIQLPETKSQTIQDRMFVVNYSELSGDRLDPIFYAADIKKIIHCTYSECISSLALSCNSGFAVGRQDQVEETNGILQIRPTNIDNNGQLKYDKNVYVPQNEGIQFLPSGVVLFNNTNSQEWVGKTAYFSNEEKRNVYISNHITAINVDKSKILPMYLSEILNMYQRHKVFYSICTNWNNQSGIGLDLLSILHIPLFTDDRQRSLVKQQEIVDHISSIRQQAKALQEEGKAILEQAKKEVEQMILG